MRKRATSDTGNCKTGQETDAVFKIKPAGSGPYYTIVSLIAALAWAGFFSIDIPEKTAMYCLFFIYLRKH